MKDLVHETALKSPAKAAPADDGSLPGRRRILFLCHRVPYPPDKGDRIRSYHLLKFLADMGDVDLAFITDEPVSSETEQALGILCRRFKWFRAAGWRRWVQASVHFATGKSATEGLFHSQGMKNLIVDWLADTEYDSIVCFSSAVLQYLRPHGIESRTVADIVDVDSQKWFDYAERSRPPISWLFHHEGTRVRRIEQAAASCRAVTFVSEPEADLYRSFCPTENSFAICNGVDLNYYAPSDAQPHPIQSCVFVGYLDYRANVTGLQWFCRHVWPEVHRRHPESVFRIVGRNPVPAVLALGEIAGVEVVGPVDDVRDYLASSTVVVVPLLVARGIQNKILEAMAAGKAVISSPVALEGVAASPGKDLLVADTETDWVTSLAELWGDPQRRLVIEQNARRFALANHNWDGCLSTFADLATPSTSTSVNSGATTR